MTTRRGQSSARARSRPTGRATRSGGTSAARGGRSPSRRPIEKSLSHQPWGILTPALTRTGVDPNEAIRRLRRYAELLIEWNRTSSNIMSSNDEHRIVERHLLESSAPASWLAESGCQDWVDFGSGAGFPAIPLAIAGVSGHWTLVESRRSKTLFLRKVLQEIQLPGFEVLHDRLENLSSESGRARAFDGFTSRATYRLGPTLTLAAPIVKPGGSAFLWKGSGRDREIEGDLAWKAYWELDGVLAVGIGANSVVRFIRRTYC